MYNIELATAAALTGNPAEYLGLNPQEYQGREWLARLVVDYIATFRGDLEYDALLEYTEPETPLFQSDLDAWAELHAELVADCEGDAEMAWSEYYGETISAIDSALRITV